MQQDIRLARLPDEHPPAALLAKYPVCDQVYDLNHMSEAYHHNHQLHEPLAQLQNRRNSPSGVQFGYR